LNFIYIVKAQMQTVGNKTVISGLRTAMVRVRLWPVRITNYCRWFRRVTSVKPKRV